MVLTRPVGSPPVAGTIEIAPRAGEGRLPPWTYEVDLGDDGSVEDSGTLEAPVRVTFSFDEPGLHPIRIVLERPNRRARLERSVNVLDPGRVEVVVTGRIESPPGAAGPFALAGIAADPVGDALLVAGAGAVFRLDPATLAVRDALDTTEGAGAPRGLAVAPDARLLYVVTDAGEVRVVDLERFETEALLEGLTAGARHVEALAGRRLLVAGEGGLELVDLVSGSVVTALELGSGERVEHLARSTAGERVAAIVLDTGGGAFLRRVVAADAGLVETGRTELTDLVLESVAWSASGETLYVRYAEDRDPGLGTDLERCGVFVLDGGMLEVVDDVPLGVTGACSAREAGGEPADPVAASADGRFLVFPSPGGVYLFDTAVDRPVARTRAAPCCGAAAAPDGDAFHLAGVDGTVARVRFTR